MPTYKGRTVVSVNVDVREKSQGKRAGRERRGLGSCTSLEGTCES